MFDVTVGNPLGPTAPASAGMRAGFVTEVAIKARDPKCGGTYRPTDKLLSLAFPTCEDHSTSVQDLVPRTGHIESRNVGGLSGSHRQSLGQHLRAGDGHAAP